MQSITSTFVGLLFPHTVETSDSNDQAYFLLYEPYFARYSVKVIAKKRMVATAFTDYDHTWDLETVIKHKKEPLLIIVTGVMDQQPIVAGYLGRVIEEKFHVVPHSISVLPCVPLVRDGLKDMVHPEVGPINFSEGVKEGYFLVNLSLNQDFNLGPEFAVPPGNDELDAQERDIAEERRRAAGEAHADNEELPNTSADENSEDEQSTGRVPNDYFTDDDEPYAPPVNYLPREKQPTGHRRLSELSDVEVDRGEDVLVQSTTIDINNLNINNDDSDNYSYSDYQVEQPGPRVPRTQRQNAQAESSTTFKAFDTLLSNFDPNSDAESEDDDCTGKGKQRADYRTTMEEVDDENDNMPTNSIDPRAFEYPQTGYAGYQSFTPSRQPSVATTSSIPPEQPSRQEMHFGINSDHHDNENVQSTPQPVKRGVQSLHSTTSSNTASGTQGKRARLTGSTDKPNANNGKKRGRPRKVVSEGEQAAAATPKKGRGRPRKQQPS